MSSLLHLHTCEQTQHKQTDRHIYTLTHTYTVQIHARLRYTKLLVLGGSGRSVRVELTAPAAVIWWLLSLKKGTVWQLLCCRQAWMWWQAAQRLQGRGLIGAEKRAELTQIIRKKVKSANSRRTADLGIHVCGGQMRLIQSMWGIPKFVPVVSGLWIETKQWLPFDRPNRNSQQILLWGHGTDKISRVWI